MTDEMRAKMEAVRLRLSGEKKAPQPTDAWERLYEQTVLEAWKRCNGDTK